MTDSSTSREEVPETGGAAARGAPGSSDKHPPAQGASAPENLGYIEDPKPPAQRKLDVRVALRQEGMRTMLALLFVILFGVTLVWALFRAKTWDETRELLEMFLPALTALLGSAVGFYFGTRS